MTDLILETGKVKLRCGHAVRIHATDLCDNKPVLLSYLMPGRGWLVLFNFLNGKHSSEEGAHPFDLIPLPQAQNFNIYEELDGNCLISPPHDDIRDALTKAKEYSFKCVSFETFHYLNGEVTKVYPEGDE